MQRADEPDRRAGRTAEDLVKYYAKGSGEVLGWTPIGLNGQVTLHETAPRYCVTVSGCPSTGGCGPRRNGTWDLQRFYARFES